MRPLSSWITAGTLTVAMLTVGTAHAAETVTVRIESPDSRLGSWILTTPDGRQITSEKEAERTIDAGPAGTSSFALRPPVGAHTTIRVRHDGALTQSTNATQLQFVRQSGSTVVIDVAYHYEGSIRIDSDPRDARFILTNATGEMRRGATPVTISMLPPGTYTVHFEPIPGCMPPRDVRRALTANAEMRISGEYDCDPSPPSPPEPPQAPVPPSADPTRHIAVRMTPETIESVPGGTASVTVSVRNVTTRTVENLQASFSLDPAIASFRETLPAGGTVEHGVARWDIPQIYAGQTWSATFPIRLHDDAAGSALATARVGGASLTQREGLTAQSIVGVAVLPETGFGIEVFAIIGLLTVSTAGVLGMRKCAARCRCSL